MGELNTRESHGRGVERLEREHRRTSPLDRPMVLLDDVVEVAAVTNRYTAPAIVFLPKQSQGAVTGRIAIQVDGARPRCSVPRNRFS